MCARRKGGCKPSEGHEFANDCWGGAASVSTSSSPVSAVEVLTLVGLISNRLGGSVLFPSRTGATAKTGREEALHLGVEIRLRGSGKRCGKVASHANLQGGYTRRAAHRMDRAGLCPGLSSPSIQTQMRQDEVTTPTMQPQPLYLFTPSPLSPSPVCICRYTTTYAVLWFYARECYAMWVGT